MALAVVTVAAGGLPVVETAAGLPVTEATNLFGLAVTKVVGKPGLPVVYSVVVPAFTTWNTADKATVNLTNSNLTATCTSGADSGVRSIASKSSGKVYFEITTGATWIGSGSSLGVATAGFLFGSGDKVGFAGVVRAIGANGGIYINGTYSGTSLGGPPAGGQLMCFSVDITAAKFWARFGAAGNWNNNVANNPATGVGGISLGAMAGAALFIAFGSVSTNDVCTANFGASAFSGAVPAGFTAGWG